MLKGKPKYDYDAALAGQPYRAPRQGDEELALFDLGLTLIASPFLILRWLLRHWAITVPAVAVMWLWSAAGERAFTIGLAVAAALMIGWRLAHPASFARLVNTPYRRRRRKRSYRRVWVATMHNAGLTRGFGSERVSPSIVKVVCGPYGDRLLVRLLVGQGVDELRAAVPALITTLGATSVKIGPEGSRPGRVWVDMTFVDRLEAVVPPIPASEPVDMSRLVIGEREDGSPWTTSLTGGSHLLVGGATGSGKSSVLWSLMNALGPLIHDGRVQVWAADPKGGMELALGAPLFARFTYGAEAGDMVEMLEAAEKLIEARAARFRGSVRSHVATSGEPHVVIVLDELAGLTAYEGDRTLSKRLERVLPRVLSQGRAVGITVVGAVQDPRKRVLDMRSLFPTRIALRTAEADDVGMILTDGAHARGALCEHISPSTPGIGYVENADDLEPVRVRASYFDDSAVRAMAEHYRPVAPFARVDGGLIDGEVIDDTHGGVAA